jgi:hypothetical protein
MKRSAIKQKGKSSNWKQSKAVNISFESGSLKRQHVHTLDSEFTEKRAVRATQLPSFAAAMFWSKGHKGGLMPWKKKGKVYSKTGYVIGESTGAPGQPQQHGGSPQRPKTLIKYPFPCPTWVTQGVEIRRGGGGGQILHKANCRPALGRSFYVLPVTQKNVGW